MHNPVLSKKIITYIYHLLNVVKAGSVVVAPGPRPPPPCRWSSSCGSISSDPNWASSYNSLSLSAGSAPCDRGGRVESTCPGSGGTAARRWSWRSGRMEDWTIYIYIYEYVAPSEIVVRSCFHWYTCKKLQLPPPPFPAPTFRFNICIKIKISGLDCSIG